MYGERIRQLRKMKKISQTALGELLHVSQSAVASWECETRTPDLETLILLSQFFEVSIDTILGNDFDESGTSLFQSAAPFIELSQELDSESKEQWLDFGRFLANKNNKTENQTDLSSSDNDS